MCTHYIRKLLALMLGLLACSAVQAALPAFDGYAAASDEELDRMRGGFEVNLNGMQLMLAFSLEQLTYINGELVSSMKLNPLELVVTNPVSDPAMAATPAISAAPATPAVSAAPATPAVSAAPAAPVASTQPSINAENTRPPIAATTAQTETMLPTAAATQIVNGQAVITLVQNGAGNAFTLPESLSSLTTVIQNTVNEQVIQNLTVLNATLSIQAAAAAMQLDAALNQAIAAGIH